MTKGKQKLVDFTRDMRTAERSIIDAEAQDRHAGGHQYKAAAKAAVQYKFDPDQIWTLATAATIDRGKAPANRTNLVDAMTFGSMFNNIDKAACKLVDDKVFSSKTMAMQNIFRRIKAGDKKGKKRVRTQAEMVAAAKLWKKNRKPARKSVEVRDGDKLTALCDALADVKKIRHKATREALEKIITKALTNNVNRVVEKWQTS